MFIYLCPFIPEAERTLFFIGGMTSTSPPMCSQSSSLIIFLFLYTEKSVTRKFRQCNKDPNSFVFFQTCLLILYFIHFIIFFRMLYILYIYIYISPATARYIEYMYYTYFINFAGNGEIYNIYIYIHIQYSIRFICTSFYFIFILFIYFLLIVHSVY